MSKLLETIKIINGIAPFLTFNQQRLNESRQPTKQIYRCRVIYEQTISRSTLPHHCH